MNGEMDGEKCMRRNQWERQKDGVVDEDRWMDGWTEVDEAKRMKRYG
jgi:hypothetical protein